MVRTLLGGLVCLLFLSLASTGDALQKKGNEAFLDPEKAGPDFLVQGEYEGKLGDKDRLGAQVVAQGDGKFMVVFLPGGLPGAGWDGKSKVKAAARTEEGKTTVTGPWSGAIADGKLTGKSADGQPFVLTRVLRKSPTLGARPPEGAIVLFDGSNADEWKGGKLVEGNLLQMGTSSKRVFGDIRLHIEFRTPFQPYAGGQGRGNSGVYLQGRYEVQVLDSFGLNAGGGDCGAIYGQKPPSVNMCFPPLSWQTYDIDYRTARLDADGKKISPATITVRHNGVLIHDNYEIKGSGEKKGEDKPGPINLQNHGNPVYYRNIWVVELPAAAAQKEARLPDGVELLRDVEFGKGGDRALKMHILRPKSLPKEPMPVLVWIHGGGWRAGSRDSGISRLGRFAQRGYFCASIEYRLSAEAKFPAQIEDCKCAIRFLRSKAKDYHLDPDRIGVWGSSAGGHLVALLGTSAHVKELEGTGGASSYSSRVQAVCDFCGPADFLRWADQSHPAVALLLGGPVAEKKELAALASPVTHIRKDLPPFLIVHGDMDKTVPLDQSQALEAALKKAGADVTLHVVKDGGHGFGGPEIDRLVDEFFDRHLKAGSKGSGGGK
jgi:acetyl esterase/lipase